MNDARVRDLFGFTPTPDFHLFWEFARRLNADAPQRAFHDASMISLVGPYDLLAGRFDSETANYDPCLHWRYFGDTPEFVTILSGGTDGLHWGYVIDRAEDLPLGIAGYYAYDDVTLFQESGSPFGVLWNAVESTLEDMEFDAKHSPELAEDEDERLRGSECRRLLDRIDSFCAEHKLQSAEPGELDYIDHCNPPPPFTFPGEKDFDQLPGLVEEGIERLTAAGASEADARLRCGRMLWHWHHDGNAVIEDLAYGLLDAAYASRDNVFLRHVLRQHREYRHRASLDVFA